ncbi:MAG: response regulator transcription factor, partial [Candidatus Obscuribacterales bacterium]|nr:response regulator transcription factor [Candidatus Obscuribacterales bacterium]
NFRVLLSGHGEEALDVAALNSPDIVILDLHMPGLDGFEVCRQLREWSKVPIIVISPSDNEQDKITVLDLGADDYVIKPFGIGEILARTRAVLRRSNFAAESELPIFTCDGLKIDYSKRRVTIDGDEVHLTPKEYDLLRYMAANADRVLTSQHLLSKFWGNQLADDNHTLRVHVANLRKKIEKDPENPRYILTEVRVGYRFRTNGVAEVSKPDRVRLKTAF